MKKFLLIPLAIILIAGMCLVGGCGGGGVVEGTTITNAVATFTYESTDPIYMESLWGWMMYDSLLRWDENNNFVGGVADSWTVSEDGCTWTFKIHEGITFHNGEALTAEDVKFSVDRFGDMSISSNPWSAYISEAYNKVSSTVIDEYTYEFVSAYPEPAQAIVFCWTRILPKDYYEAVGIDEFRANPVGSGPWKWGGLISQTELTLEANTDYWREDEIPHYQYYVELMVPELATRIAMLKTGECDIASGVNYDRIDDLVADGYAVENLYPPGTCSLFYQGTWLPGAGPTADLEVRQAMSVALNRQEICDTFFAGYARPGGQFYMYPGCYGWSDDLNTDSYDPQQAMDLLADAGYPDAFDDPVIHVYTTPEYGLYGGQDLVLLLMNYWEAVGLQVEMEVVDSTIAAGYTFQGFYGEPIKEGDTNVGWCGIWNYQAFFNMTYQAANMYTPGGAHCTSNDAHARELFDKAVQELDPETAEQYWNDFQVYVKSLYINVGIAETDNLFIYNPETIGAWEGRTWTSFWDAVNGIQQP